MTELDSDTLDLLNALDEEGAEYVLVGAHAMAAHGLVRATSDVDLLVKANEVNAQRVYRALVAFGAPVAAHGVDATYFTQEGRVYQLGLPPRRIDLLSSISGVTTREAFDTAEERTIGGTLRKVLSAQTILKNKRSTGRPKHAVDVERLEQVLKDEARRPK